MSEAPRVPSRVALCSGPGTLVPNRKLNFLQIQLRVLFFFFV